jgi:uncharacterized protein with HEPN domain
MPPREWSFRVRDILQSIESIEEYVRGMTYELFAGDRKTKDAVIRNLAIIGEAANHIPAEVRARSPAVPWDEMRRLRNVVVHVYFGVDFSDVWQTIQKDLPPLKAQLNELLRQASGDK